MDGPRGCPPTGVVLEVKGRTYKTDVGPSSSRGVGGRTVVSVTNWVTRSSVLTPGVVLWGPKLV